MNPARYYIGSPLSTFVCFCSSLTTTLSLLVVRKGLPCQVAVQKVLPSYQIMFSRVLRPSARLAAALPKPRFASHVAPRADFAKITPSSLSAILKLVGESSQVQSTIATEGYTPVEPEELLQYNVDWMDKYKGKSGVVVKPKTTQEVANVLKWCNDNNVAVVPQGGNTGLVGGSVPVHDELILNLSNLNTVRNFDSVSGVLTADAGCILEALDIEIGKDGYMMPLDLGAKGSCHIGGNVATNAGGLRLLRYGSLHGSVLGLEVVTADGKIVDLGVKAGLRKDNTGLDLKQLFIGSEGTLGIITAVTILCPRRPTSTNVALFALSSFEAVQTCFSATKQHVGEILSAFEFFDKQSFDMVHKYATGAIARDPLEEKAEFYVLIETGGSNDEHDSAKLESLLEHLLESEIISDGVLAQDSTQLAALWSLRESIPEAAGKCGSVYKYDLSVPVPKMYSLVEKMRERLTEKGLFVEGDEVNQKIKAIVGYGHVGDSNLHINIAAQKWDSEVEAAIEPLIYELTAAENGSISAEHGLGVMKASHIHYSKTPEAIEMMKQIKKTYDPKGILNPYKYVLV